MSRRRSAKVRRSRGEPCLQTGTPQGPPSKTPRNQLLQAPALARTPPPPPLFHPLPGGLGSPGLRLVHRAPPRGAGGIRRDPEGPPGRAFCFWKVLPPTPEHSGHLDRTLGTDQALPTKEAPSQSRCAERRARALFARRGCATPGSRESPRPEPIQPRPSGEAASASPVFRDLESSRR